MLRRYWLLQMFFLVIWSNMLSRRENQLPSCLLSGHVFLPGLILVSHVLTTFTFPPFSRRSYPVIQYSSECIHFYTESDMITLWWMQYACSYQIYTERFLGEKVRGNEGKRIQVPLLGYTLVTSEIIMYVFCKWTNSICETKGAPVILKPLRDWCPRHGTVEPTCANVISMMFYITRTFPRT